MKSNAFPKIIFDRTKLSAWSNKVGQAIGVVGNPNDAVVSGYRGPDMSGQVMDLIDRLIQKTLEVMGEIEQACHVRFTGVVNNSNLGRLTEREHVEGSVPYAERVCELAGLPLIMTSYSKELGPLSVPEPFPVTIYTKDIWKL